MVERFRRGKIGEMKRTKDKKQKTKDKEKKTEKEQRQEAGKRKREKEKEVKLKIWRRLKAKIPKLRLLRIPYKRIWQGFLIGFFLLTFLLILVFSAYHLVFAKTIYPGVSIAGIDLSGKTITQATQILEANFPAPDAQLTISGAGQTWSLPTSEINLVFNSTASAKRAFYFSRSGDFKGDLKKKWRAFFKKESLLPVYSLNTRALDKKLLEFSALVDIKPIPAAISIQKDKVSITESRAGQKLDREKFLLLLYQRLENLNLKEPVLLPIISLQPKLDEEKAKAVQEILERLIEKPLVLNFQDFSFNLKAENVLPFFLPLEKGDLLNQEAVREFVNGIAEQINRPPQDAVFQFASGKVNVFKPSLDGYQLDEEKTTELIQNHLTVNRQPSTVNPISLPVKIIKPAVATEQVNNLGIKEKIGRGVSHFRGSISSRIHNLTLASSVLNGVLIPPNNTFSFNQTLGEISEKTGYKQAYIIKSGRTILDDGGGVCQVSTTVFRAALNAGLPIIERTAHAYRVAYYEQNSQVGLDATVYEPAVDLKFKNDTPGYILIQTTVDKINKVLIFDFYGTDDGRKVIIGKSVITNQVPPPKPIHQDDPSLPKGETKQIDWPAWGASVKFPYKVTRNGEVLQNKTFNSRYRPWQAIYLVGTKEN